MQRLIGEVAKRHNMLLGPDDPIFIHVTLNELVVGQLLQRAQEAIADSLAQVALVPGQARDAAQATAEQIITGAAGYVAKEINAAAGELEARLRAAAREEMAQIRAAQADVQQARRAAWRAAVAAMAAVCLIAGGLLASWFGAGLQDRGCQPPKRNGVSAGMVQCPSQPGTPAACASGLIA